MMYGLLIGLILFGLLLLASNWSGQSQGHITLRTIGLGIFLPSLGALIGLIIRGS
jgi:hypothetical protein